MGEKLYKNGMYIGAATQEAQDIRKTVERADNVGCKKNVPVECEVQR